MIIMGLSFRYPSGCENVFDVSVIGSRIVPALPAMISLADSAISIPALANKISFRAFPRSLLRV